MTFADMLTREKFEQENMRRITELVKSSLVENNMKYTGAQRHVLFAQPFH